MGPDPNTLYPMIGYNKLVFLKNCIRAPNISVGDFTYFDDPLNGPERFEELNVLYNYHPDRVRLEIGKFCAIARETKFLMTGDHKLDGFSTYPFPIFQKGWEAAYQIDQLPMRGNIIVGNDVWFGYDSFIRGGVTIGNGAIIAARAVVVKDVPPYAVVAGNPAKVVKMRFPPETIIRLLEIRWWDWPIEKINTHITAITEANLQILERANATRD